MEGFYRNLAHNSLSQLETPIHSTNTRNKNKDDANDRIQVAENEVEILKDLFFRYNIPPGKDCATICIEKHHDLKFWALVTHDMGISIMRTLFSLDLPYQDQMHFTNIGYFIKSKFNNENFELFNYITGIKNQVATLLLSGMIENRIPGSLRLILRCNGYQFFEHRINTLLSLEFDKIDTMALSYNLKALSIIFPYLLEYKEVKLSRICYKFITSGLWKFMWIDLGTVLRKRADSDSDLRACTNEGTLFISFLDLLSVVFYGSRGPGLLKRLYESCSASLWETVCTLIAWGIDLEVLTRVISFVADLLVLGISDSCVHCIPPLYMKKLLLVVSDVESIAREYCNELNNKLFDTRNSLVEYHARIALEMLTKLKAVLMTENKGEFDTLYSISFMAINTLTIPILDSSHTLSTKKGIFKEQRQFPRILPCFNNKCSRVYHVELPEYHLDQSDMDFFYCKGCGIPSYCSESCAKQHWFHSHKSVFCLHVSL
ncbi:hypothetical protein BdWA1_002652 [Babesia duncani]|uniref:MYND-type domain-containing protein n=1 Tax=Babesia duncani TaxID=323732 RepID=A0AAD9PJM1_9APIC|nr:hypothetical protein BdWA1_002652 [Babesia duncani]